MLKEKIPKVSVCVITYNHEQYIRQCLQSIVDQDVNFEYEVIVGEDCSSDGTREIVQEFQMNYPLLFRSIMHKSNAGGCENYRCVHFAAKGEYIAHIDGDDFWHPGKLLSQVNFLDENQNCSAVYTNALVQTASGEIIGVFSSGVRKLFDVLYLIKKGNFLAHSSIMYRSKYRDLTIPTTGDFVDYLLHIRLARYGKLGFIDNLLVTYTSQSTTSIILNNSDKVRLLIWDALKEIDLPNDLKSMIKESKILFISEAIVSEIHQGGFKKILKWITLLSDENKREIPMIILNVFSLTILILLKKLPHLFFRVAGKKRDHLVLHRK